MHQYILFILCILPFYIIFFYLHNFDKIDNLLKLGKKIKLIYLVPVLFSIFSFSIALGFTASDKFIYFDF